MPGDTLNVNNKAVAQNTYDAIVIGSGISGGWAAKELTEKGLKVLMLERGRDFQHIKDYKTAGLNPWEFKHRGRATLEYKNNNPVISRDWAMYGTAAQEALIDYWVNEKDSPYVETKPFTWWRSYQLGGRSILWGRQCYRWSDLDFEANAKDGIAVDWPIRYKDLEKWYDYVETFAGISGSKEGLQHLPDGQFLPPMDLNCVERDVASRIKEHYKNQRYMFIGRVANLTQPIPNRTKCQFRNRCWEGCPFGGYFSTQSSTLPAALKTGNLTVRPWSIVTKIIYDKDSKKAKGVEVLDAETNKTYEFYAKVVFLNASALNSTWVLMNSATDVWPDGLGSSDELGHNVMDHHYMLGAMGVVEGYEDKYYFGRRANGFYIPRFVNLYGDKRDYLRGFGYQGSASREGWSRDIAELNVGAAYKDALTEPGAWYIGATGFGEILPYHENKISLDKNVKDKWGLPVIAMDAVMKENEYKMRKDIVKELVSMFEVAGVKNIRTWDSKEYAIGQGIHEMGTARMGRDPKTSVLNAHNQVWDAPNVFVTDGACMTSSACQNPSLTYMALTARAADYAANELKKGNI